MFNMKLIRGKVYLLGDDINTDDLVPSHVLTLGDINEMVKHVLEYRDPNFLKEVKKGMIIIAGDNFGTGSSREEAVNVLKVIGISAIIARSFARIYFRNLINNGIPAIITNWNEEQIEKNDILEINLNEGVIYNETKNISLNFPKIPPFLMNILNEGGIINLVKKQLRKTNNS